MFLGVEVVEKKGLDILAELCILTFSQPKDTNRRIQAMSQGMILFRQLQGRLPWSVVTRSVAAEGGDYKVHRATCRSHILVLLLAMLLRHRSLREIENGLSGRLRYLKLFGVGSVDRSTLSYANRHRPAAVAEAVFATLLRQAQAAAPGHPLRFRNKLYTLDATEIRVCSTLFEWAQASPDKCGVKLHVFLDHDGALPCLVEFATMKHSELALARRRTYAPGSVLCFDRGYFDSAWLEQLTVQGVIFVTRLPEYVHYDVVQERTPCAEGVLADEIIRFNGPKASRRCHGLFRLITYYDPVADRILQFLTNQMTWSALTIGKVYKARWQIELFFKWIKQNLKIKHFYGNDENAVRWQVLIALCLYLLLALLKFQNQVDLSLRDIHRRLAQYLFDLVTLKDVLHGTYQFQT
jgi:putative transposase